MDVNLARDRAAAEFDAQQAQQNNKKATKEAESEAKKLANQQESVNQKLETVLAIRARCWLNAGVKPGAGSITGSAITR